MSTIVITGGTGRLGANLCRRLAEAGHEVVATLLPGDGQEPKLDGLDVRKAYLDIMDTDAVAAALSGADAVVHCAAVMEDVMDSIAPSHAFDINVKGAFNVLEGLRRSGKTATRLVCLSSTAVYDVFSVPRTPTKEDQSCRPLTLYGMQKALIEEQVRQYGWQHDVPFTLIRPNHIVAGPEVLDVFTCGTVLNALRNHAHKKKTQLHAVGDPRGWEKAIPALESNPDALCVPVCPGEQSWRWHMTDVRDAVRLIEVCLEDDRALGKTFNVAAADPCEWGKIVPYIAKVTACEVVEVEIPNLWQFSFDQDLSHRTLDFQPESDHEAIIDTAIAMRDGGGETGIIPGEIAPVAFEVKA